MDMKKLAKLFEMVLRNQLLILREIFLMHDDMIWDVDKDGKCEMRNRNKFVVKYITTTQERIKEIEDFLGEPE